MKSKKRREPRPRQDYGEPGDGRLTSREVEVLRAVASGLSNKEIAKQLHLSLYTIKNHVHSILEKLNVGTRSGAVLKIHGVDLAKVDCDGCPYAARAALAAVELQRIAKDLERGESNERRTEAVDVDVAGGGGSLGSGSNGQCGDDLEHRG